jgi:hypothetical protein
LVTAKALKENAIKRLRASVKALEKVFLKK